MRSGATTTTVEDLNELFEGAALTTSPWLTYDEMLDGLKNQKGYEIKRFNLIHECSEGQLRYGWIHRPHGRGTKVNGRTYLKGLDAAYRARRADDVAEAVGMKDVELLTVIGAKQELKASGEPYRKRDTLGTLRDAVRKLRARKQEESEAAASADTDASADASASADADADADADAENIMRRAAAASAAAPAAAPAAAAAAAAAADTARRRRAAAATDTDEAPGKAKGARMTSGVSEHRARKQVESEAADDDVIFIEEFSPPPMLSGDAAAAAAISAAAFNDGGSKLGKTTKGKVDPESAAAPLEKETQSSSSFTDCPVCFRSIPSSLINSHVNKCIDAKEDTAPTEPRVKKGKKTIKEFFRSPL